MWFHAVYLRFAPCDDLDVHQLAANQLPKTFRIHALKDVIICLNDSHVQIVLGWRKSDEFSGSLQPEIRAFRVVHARISVQTALPPGRQFSGFDPKKRLFLVTMLVTSMLFLLEQTVVYPQPLGISIRESPIGFVIVLINVYNQHPLRVPLRFITFLDVKPGGHRRELKAKDQTGGRLNGHAARPSLRRHRTPWTPSHVFPLQSLG